MDIPQSCEVGADDADECNRNYKLNPEPDIPGTDILRCPSPLKDNPDNGLAENLLAQPIEQVHPGMSGDEIPPKTCWDVSANFPLVTSNLGNTSHTETWLLSFFVRSVASSPMTEASKAASYTPLLISNAKSRSSLGVHDAT